MRTHNKPNYTIDTLVEQSHYEVEITFMVPGGAPAYYYTTSPEPSPDAIDWDSLAIEEPYEVMWIRFFDYRPQVAHDSRKPSVVKKVVNPTHIVTHPRTEEEWAFDRVEEGYVANDFQALLVALYLKDRSRNVFGELDRPVAAIQHVGISSLLAEGLSISTNHSRSSEQLLTQRANKLTEQPVFAKWLKTFAILPS